MTKLAKPGPVAQYYANRAFRAAMAAAYPWRKKYSETGAWIVDSAWKDVKNAITGSKFHRGHDEIGKWRERWEIRVRSAFGEAYSYLDRNLTVGGTPQVNGTQSLYEKTRGGKPKWSYQIRVGWTWKQKVFEPLLEKGHLFDKDWIVLAVEELRVNERLVSLYKAQAYHIPTHSMMPAYIAQSKVGERKAYIKGTASDAIKLAMRAVEKTINKELSGENS